MDTNTAFRRRFYGLGRLLLLIVFFQGCDRSGQQPAESATPAPPESSAVESLFRSNADYERWFYFYVRHSSYVHPGDANVYRELRRLGYINIDADTPEYKHRAAAGAHMIVSLTDRGNALPGLEKTRDGWGLPLAQQQIVSITPAGQGPAPDRLYRYNVVYQWHPNGLGSEIEPQLPARSKPPTGFSRWKRTSGAAHRDCC